MKKRALCLGLILLLLAVTMAPAVIVTWIEWDLGRRESASTSKLRQLAAIDDARLATLLDDSVIYIEAGIFVMGSDQGRPDERPQRIVYLDAFEIDRYEVTNLQYLLF
jgi:formylglycine-generating enzyme required for sulfatase activity